MTDQIATLIERADELTGPDAEFDSRLRQYVEGWRNEGGGWRTILATGTLERYDYTRGAPAYSGSLDAIVALVEKVLPEWAFYIEKIDDISSRKHVCEADIWLPAQRSQGLKQERFRAGAATPAIALCVALLRSLQSKGQTNDQSR